MDTYAYIHVCCLNQWQQVFASLMSRIKQSGLYEELTEIRCGVVGAYAATTVFDDPKVVIAGQSDNLQLYETSTLNLLHAHAQQEDFHVLYLHTKGVSHEPQTSAHANILDWVNYMSHFTIDQHARCRESLQTHDAVGVNLQDGHPDDALHYSGNFWWSKSAYIRTLSKCLQSSHNAPEFWLTETRSGSYLSLWTSGVDHYAEPYPQSRYVGTNPMPTRVASARTAMDASSRSHGEGHMP